LNKLDNYDPKNIRSFMNEHSKLCVYNLRHLLTSKNFSIPIGTQLNIYSYLFLILEKHSVISDYDEELIVHSLFTVV
jgi:hypothetical protein